MSSQSETSQFDPSDEHAPGAGPHDGPGGPGGPGTDEPSGPPYRAIAMVLLAAVVLAIGVGLVQLFGGDDASTPTAAEGATSQAQPQGQPAGSGQPGEGPAGQDSQAAPGASGQEGQAQPSAGAQSGSVPAVTSVPVLIFNNSNVTGLAARTGEALRETGFAVGDVANLPSNQGVVAESTAYYGTGPGEQQAAEAIAAQLGITARPRPAELAGQAPGVIVIVTQDLDR
ncbi:LytR C-terminal domain-containing protein [Dietzia sp. UBA5065]|uniref:LytR C-terminal domain-containing protein n=1 Tax=Dietzia sp. UBA5065 TaxID=1946422 RepID=UPI0025BE2590|nr:LytR C-terminal domain-containing protein [Dietzia sp. UBA5065]HMT49793.1 LytR C-terminal domain-containing protein [Dietzia sp.]